MSGRGGPLVWLALVICVACGHVEQQKASGEGGKTSGESSKTSSKGDEPSDGATAACTAYCDAVMAACTGEDAVYTSDSACLSVCALLDAGDPEELSGDNTVACRNFWAQEAEREPAEFCSAAGPGGAGRCGSDCEAYCALYPQVCPDEADAQGTETCIEACGALVDQRDFDVVRDHGGDTVECRLVHVTSAALNATAHCQHAQLAPTQPWCVSAP